MKISSIPMGKPLSTSPSRVQINLVDPAEFEPAGAAEGAVTEHEAAADPHPQYATKTELADGLATKAEGDHTHAEYLTADELPAAPDLSGLATKTELADGLATKAEDDHTHAEYLTADDLPEPVEPYDDPALSGRVEALETATPTLAIVEHGVDAGMARPAATVVHWYGSVEPTNATAKDHWYGGGA